MLLNLTCTEFSLQKIAGQRVRGVARGYLAARGYLVRDIRGGTLHADISHPADISHFFCYEISAGDLARGYLVTPNHVALNLNITQIKSIVLDINS